MRARLIAWWNRPVAPAPWVATLRVVVAMAGFAALNAALIPTEAQVYAAWGISWIGVLVLARFREEAAFRRGLRHRSESPRPNLAALIVGFGILLAVIGVVASDLGDAWVPLWVGLGFIAFEAAERRTYRVESRQHD